jgi:Homing endonuclease associated repeat
MDGDLRARVRDFPGRRPGSTLKDVALALGVVAADVSRVMGDDARRLLVRERAKEDEYADADIIAVLAAVAAAHGNPLAADTYEVIWRDYSGPSSVRIVQRFGSWNAACRAAGLRTNPGRPAYTRQWSEVQLLSAVADYLESPGSRGTYAGYDAWARLGVSRPSAQTVRNQVGNWATAKKAALALVEARRRRPLRAG